MAVDRDNLSLALTGPEENVTVEIDHINIKLPLTSVYPHPNNVCKNLVQNEFPDSTKQFMFPLWSFVRDEELSIDTDNNDTTFYHLDGHKFPYSTLTWDLTPGCLIA